MFSVAFDTLASKIISNSNYHLEILSSFKLLVMLQYSVWYVQVIYLAIHIILFDI